MTINSIVKVDIRSDTTRPSQRGFGTPIIFSADPTLNPKSGREWGGELVRTYNSVTAVGDDFDLTTNVYVKASKLFSQERAPKQLKIGRLLTTPSAQTVDFTVKASPLAGETIGFTINGVEYSVAGLVGDANGTATALRAETPPAGVTFGGATDVVTITVTAAGERVRVGALTGGSGGTFEDTTSAGGTGLVTDFNAAVDADNDFYAVFVDAASAHEIEALSDHIESLANTNPKMFIVDTIDTLVTAAVDTSSIAYTLKLSNNDRTVLNFTKVNDGLSDALGGRVLPEDAGTVNWAWMELSNVASDNLTDSEKANLKAKYVNFYSPYGNIAFTQWGRCIGGEWADNVRGSDWTAARIQERVVALLLGRNKVPFTDDGLAQIQSEILSQLKIGVSRGLFAATPAPTCTVPLVADISQADKDARHLKDVVFRATYAGAVNSTDLVGEISL